MRYLLFLNHPKGEKVYKVSKTKERLAKKYFKQIDTLQTSIQFEGKTIPATVDFNIFNKLSNFDCFNCQDPCCGDTPAIFSEKTRDFLLHNLKKYDEQTKIPSILEDFGLTSIEISDSIKNNSTLIPDEFIEDDITMCSCSYKPNNCSTLCSIHSIALEKKLSFENIVKLKPLVCSLWPLEILVEDDMSRVFITLPDDFTNNFISEDYYNIACINQEFTLSPLFRRDNPLGFDEKNYTPFYLAYKDTLIFTLGEKFYNDTVKKIEESDTYA
ncbi:MAG: hypothetical protein ACRCZ2_02700 [Fusobacteriaceae bacterium]